MSKYEGLVLPTEILIDVLLHVDPKEIKNMCATNAMYSAICSDEYFQKQYRKKWGVVTRKEVLPRLVQKYSKNGKTLQLNNKGIDSLVGFPEMDDLEHLFLDRNQISSLEGLPDLPKLDALSLGSNKISSLEGFPQLKNLETLSLNHNQLASMKGLPVLSKLTELDVSENNLTSFKGLPEIRSGRLKLHIGYNQISSLEGLSALQYLESLEVSGDDLDNEIVDGIKRFCWENAIECTFI